LSQGKDGKAHLKLLTCNGTQATTIITTVLILSCLKLVSNTFYEHDSL